jgi:hypothetical protein
VKILIELSPEYYDAFLTSCTGDRREYAILKNGIIVSRQIEGATRRLVKILCDESDAQKLLTAAKSLDLPAVGEIRRALDPLFDL